jgi:trans-aconitate 2-methyltransferase
MWNPQQYQRFSDERSRPFFDLLSRVPDGEVRTVVDLGCGPGNLTHTLLTRWSDARVIGVDNSPDMLAVATQLPPSPRLRFVEGDIALWQPDRPIDRLISNAALHWVPDHPILLPRLVNWLSPSGVLAVQAPYHLDQPAQRLLDETRAREPWVSILGLPQARYFVQPSAWYVDTLEQLGLSVDLWETIYYHILTGSDAVLEWMKGTALRPLLARLSEEQQIQFLREYGEHLRVAYPSGPQGTVFPFRRLFFVATRISGVAKEPPLGQKKA